MKKSLFPLLRIDVSRKRGISLVETIIALLILSIALLALAGVPIMTSKVAIQSAKRDQAMFLGVQTLDFLEAQGHDVAIVGSKDVIGNYTRLFEKPAFSTVSPDLYFARVTITWDSVSGKSSLTLERPLSKFSSETRKE